MLEFVSGLCNSRCAPHILQIIVRRICWHRKENKRLRGEDAPADPRDCLAVLAPLSKLRELARKFTEPTWRRTWLRKKWGGPHGKMLAADSGTDWGSTLQLVEAALKTKDGLEQACSARVTTDETAHDLFPTEQEWQVLAELADVLELINNAVNLLQARDSLACQVVPVLMNLQQKLRQLAQEIPEVALNNMPELFFEELKSAVDDHLFSAWDERHVDKSHPVWKLLKAATIKCPWELLEVACLLSSKFAFLPASRHDNTRQKLGLLLEEAWYQLHPADRPTAAGRPAAEQPPPGPPVARPQQPSGARKDKGGRRRASMREMKADLDGDAPPDPRGVPALSHPAEKVGFAVRALLGMKMPGSSSGQKVLAWYKGLFQNKSTADPFLVLLPGLEFLLGLPAGNGELERFFGKAKSVVMDLRRHSTNFEALSLYFNAPCLRLPGYSVDSPALNVAGEDYVVDEADEEEADEYDDMDASCRTAVAMQPTEECDEYIMSGDEAG